MCEDLTNPLIQGPGERETGPWTGTSRAPRPGSAPSRARRASPAPIARRARCSALRAVPRKLVQGADPRARVRETAISRSSVPDPIRNRKNRNGAVARALDAGLARRARTPAVPASWCARRACPAAGHAFSRAAPGASALEWSRGGVAQLADVAGPAARDEAIDARSVSEHPVRRATRRRERRGELERRGERLPCRRHDQRRMILRARLEPPSR